MEQQDTEPASITASKTKQAQAISHYILSGTKNAIENTISTTNEHLGLELEHFIVQKSNKAYIPYLEDAQTGQPGVSTVLRRLLPYYREALYEPQSDGSQCLMGLSRPFANITLEPGAQLEISIGPVSTIAELDAQYKNFRSELELILDELDLAIVELGYHPTANSRNIPLLPKERYRFMAKHFESTGQHGICMMRATASTQVSIDFSSENDAIQKLRIASLLSPLFAFVTDNSPIFENEPIASRGNSKRKTKSGLPVADRMVRTAIWNDVDAKRSLTVPGLFNEDFDLFSYALEMLGSPAIFSFATDNDKSAGDSQYLGDQTFADWLRDKTLDQQSIEHILSLFFYDVRLKTYVEIRAADAMPIEYALAYAALIKGVFYNEAALDSLARSLKDFDIEDIIAAKESLGEEGYDALVYSRPAEQWLDELILSANDNLPADERAYLEPLATLIAGRRTLVDMA
jgi:glutamate--cysteine ligase